METRHFRDGQELEEINRDDHYSTHFQEIRPLHNIRQVLPVCPAVLLKLQRQLFENAISGR